MDVRVDGHASCVCNPFCEADNARLCRAYDELLRMLLTVNFTVDECLRDFEGITQDGLPTLALLTPVERHLLRTISERHDVRVQRLRTHPFAIRSWLVHHARLIAHGQSLRLLSWCPSNAVKSTPWIGHAQLLMGALLWLAAVRREELLSSSHPFVSESTTLQVRVLSSLAP